MALHFEWYESDDSTKKAQTQWTPFAETTKYFEPSSKILDKLPGWKPGSTGGRTTKGVTIVDKIEAYDYGKFVHILDAEGNKVQLWEAIDYMTKPGNMKQTILLLVAIQF